MNHAKFYAEECVDRAGERLAEAIEFLRSADRGLEHAATTEELRTARMVRNALTLASLSAETLAELAVYVEQGGIRTWEEGGR